MIQLQFEFVTPPPKPVSISRPTLGGFVVSVTQAAEISGVEEQSIYYALHIGELIGWKVGRLWRIWRDHVEDYAFRRSA